MNFDIAETPNIEAFEAVWAVTANGAAFPRFESLGVHAAVYGGNALGLEVIGDGEDFRYIFVGDVVRRRTTAELTGMRMSMLPGRGPGSLVFANALRVFETGRPSRQSIAYLGVGAESIETRQIMAPCGPRGGRPTHLVCVIDYIPRSAARGGAPYQPVYEARV